MKKIIITFVFFTFSAISIADYDPNSPFIKASIPASVLDVELSQLQPSLNEGFLEKHKLKVFFHLSWPPIHHSRNDVIEISAWIMDVNKFLLLTKKERIQLLKDILSFTTPYLNALNSYRHNYNKGKYVAGWQSTAIFVVINEDWQELSRKVDGIPFGQAAFFDGNFVYSNSHYLDLSKNKNGYITSQDPSLYVELYPKKKLIDDLFTKNSSQKEVTAEQFWFELRQQVPDFDKINTDPKFIAWLQKSSPNGVPYQQLLNEAGDKLDAPAAIDIFRQYIKEQIKPTKR